MRAPFEHAAADESAALFEVEAIEQLPAPTSSPFDHVAAAWMLAGSEIAIISHESALELYDLSDVIPSEALTSPSRAATAIGRLLSACASTTRASPLQAETYAASTAFRRHRSSGRSSTRSKRGRSPSRSRWQSARQSIGC